MVTITLDMINSNMTAISIPALTSIEPNGPANSAKTCIDAASVIELAIRHSCAGNDHQLNQHQPPPNIVTPVNADLLELKLQGHLDRLLVQQVMQGFRFGLHLKYNGPPQGRVLPNLASARQFPKQLQQCLNKEIVKGQIFGPFKHKRYPNLICSPVGMVPKKELGKMCMITHLSYPTEQSINSFIAPEDAATQYQSFDSASAIISKY